MFSLVTCYQTPFLVEVLSVLSNAVSIIDLSCGDKKSSDLSTLLRVPMVTVDPIQDTTPRMFVSSIRPSYQVVNQALFDIMDSFSFSKVAVVYDGKIVRTLLIFIVILILRRTYLTSEFFVIQKSGSISRKVRRGFKLPSSLFCFNQQDFVPTLELRFSPYLLLRFVLSPVSFILSRDD